MVINNLMTINAVAYTDYDSLSVRSSSARFNTTSSFTAMFTNYTGVHDNDFVIGQEVVVKADKNTNPATTTIFTGILEDVQYSGNPNSEMISLTGRDYGLRLMDSFVQPEVYTNTEVSVIVKDLIDKYVTGITYTNVATTTITVSRIVFREVSVFDAIKQLAELASYDFYVDVNKDLNFNISNSISSGQTFDNTNVLSCNFRETNQELYNSVRVYGGTYMTGYKDEFTADGAGSVFTTTYKPFSTTVTVSGGSGTFTKIGGAEFQVTNPSGIDYTVSQEDKQIIFISGTANGDKIPENGQLLTATYDRAVPIIKFGQDSSSITAYGKREKVVINNEITDPRQASTLVKTILNDGALTKKMGEIKLYGTIASLQAGRTCIVNLPYENINSSTYNMLEVRYDFTTANNLSESVVTVKVSDKIRNLVDTLKQMINDIKKLQAGDVLSTDLITRLVGATGSIGPGYNFYVRNRNVGASFILGHSINGVLGSPAASVSGPNVVLGDQRPASVIQVSGGNKWSI